MPPPRPSGGSRQQKGWQPGQGYQQGQPNFEVIRAWNAASVYQQAIAIMGAKIDG